MHVINQKVSSPSLHSILDDFVNRLPNLDNKKDSRDLQVRRQVHKTRRLRWDIAQRVARDSARLIICSPALELIPHNANYLFKNINRWVSKCTIKYSDDPETPDLI